MQVLRERRLLDAAADTGLFKRLARGCRGAGRVGVAIHAAFGESPPPGGGANQKKLHFAACVYTVANGGDFCGRRPAKMIGISGDARVVASNSEHRGPLG